MFYICEVNLIIISCVTQIKGTVMVELSLFYLSFAKYSLLNLMFAKKLLLWTQMTKP